MIFGIGVDCATIERVEASMQKPHFTQRVFSEGEQALFLQRHGKRAAESAAACFAAKEAFMKAAGVGLGGFALQDIAALRHESGAPYLQLSGSAAAFCEENGLTAHLSLTHEHGMAMAFVVLSRQ